MLVTFLLLSSRASELPDIDDATTTVVEESTTILPEILDEPPSSQVFNTPEEFANKCQAPLCISKCCPQGMMKEVYGGCVNVSKYKVKDWAPDPSIVDDEQLELLTGIPDTPAEDFPGVFCLLHTSNELSLQSDGTVYLWENKKYITPDLYCMDNMYNEGNT